MFTLKKQVTSKYKIQHLLKWCKMCILWTNNCSIFLIMIDHSLQYDDSLSMHKMIEIKSQIIKKIQIKKIFMTCCVNKITLTLYSYKVYIKPNNIILNTQIWLNSTIVVNTRHKIQYKLCIQLLSWRYIGESLLFIDIIILNRDVRV
jgi:hypothetical protein